MLIKAWWDPVLIVINDVGETQQTWAAWSTRLIARPKENGLLG